VNLLVEEGLLLPAESLALLASGPEGALAIAEYGWPTGDFDTEFAAMEERLVGAGDEESLLELEASRRIATIAADACGWISIRGVSGGLVPTVLVVGHSSAIAARLHGETVEWIAGGPDFPGRLVAASLDAIGEGSVGLTAFAGGAALCGALITDGNVDVAGPDSETVERLTAAAKNGVHPLVDCLTAEVGNVR
jgi:hypothetical protein